MLRLFSAVLLICLCSAQEAPRSLDRIASREEFDRLARTHFEGRFNALPNVIFAIDRAQGGRVYYINSRRYTFHNEFLAADYLTLERGSKFYESNYRSLTRRFLLGAIAWQAKRERFTFEFWEGDLTTPELLREAFQRITESFFAPISFKANSAQQTAIALQLPEIPQLIIDVEGDYIPLNLSSRIGILRILDRMTEETIIDRNEILIFREPPLRLTPCSGLVTTTFGTPLAHVNLLARGWGIPNAFIKGAAEAYRPLEGKFVFFETREEGFTIRPAETAETAEEGRRAAVRSHLLTPAADLNFRLLTPLSEQRKGDARKFGAKSANLGEVAHAIETRLVKDVTVPAGFGVPFFYYDQFVTQNKLDRVIVEMLGNDRFNHDPAYRKSRLKDLRAMIERGSLDSSFSTNVWKRTHRMFGEKGVFVRSSTNAEDLENFSGAGLYTTVPNVRGRAALMQAIKAVWASIWNFEAYEARESAGINHAAVYPAVLVQEGVPAEAAGVLITTNPFDLEDHEGVYINAKRGLGIRVVEGQRVPEQLVYGTRTGEVRVLTRSRDDTMLTFDDRGGLREQKVETERRVLTDQMVVRLARAALEIERVFGGKDQDIEWVTVGRSIFIVQSRPYIH